MPNRFQHDGKEFEIRHHNDGTKISVKIFCDDKQVSPKYSANIEVAQDYFRQHGEKILETLKNMAKQDIENNLYFHAEGI
jgi:hypothetical protein